MRPSIMFEKNGGLTLRDFSSTGANDISSIDVYVASATKRQVQVFLYMIDQATGLHEIVELHQGDNGYGKPVFRVPLTYSLRFTNTSVKFKLIVVDVEADTSEVSSWGYSKIKTENYELARETAMVRQLSDSVVKYYEAIVKVLQEVIEKGENAE